MQDGEQTGRRAGDGVGNGEVVAAVEGCARFLHGFLAVGDDAARLGQRSGRRARRFGGLELRARRNESRAGVGEHALGFGPRHRFVIGGFLGGALSVLAAVERVIEGETIVALIDGLMRVFERLLCREELFVRIPVRAGRAGGVDGALRLIDLFVGRSAASSDHE